MDDNVLRFLKSKRMKYLEDIVELECEITEIKLKINCIDDMLEDLEEDDESSSEPDNEVIDE